MDLVHWLQQSSSEMYSDEEASRIWRRVTGQADDITMYEFSQLLAAALQLKFKFEPILVPPSLRLSRLQAALWPPAPVDVKEPKVEEVFCWSDEKLELPVRLARILAVTRCTDAA